MNFGCEQGISAVARFPLPKGARQVDAHAHWEGVHNAKSFTQSWHVEDGTAIVGDGNILGLDRDWLNNCPGGGNGELVLTGTYVIDQQVTNTEPTTKTVDDTMSPGEIKSFSIPSKSAEIATTDCQISITNTNGEVYGQASVKLLESNGEYQGSIENLAGKVRVSVENNKIKVDTIIT